MADDKFSIEKIIGIDFGTTKSVAAVMQEGKPVVIPCQEGNSITPSLVSFSKAHEIIVGTKARSQAVLNPSNTIVSIKRYLGRTYSDPEIQGLLSSVPCQVKQATDDEIQIICDQREYTPCLISALILRQIKANAEAFLGGNIFKAVIAVPTCYNDTQRNAIIDAGESAGLDVVGLINDTTASSMAYSYKRKRNELLAVFDLGGGHFNFSVVRLHEGVIEVKATGGNLILGGDDFDQRIVDYLVEEFLEETKIDLHQEYRAMQRLREAAEKAKIELSSAKESEINLPFISADANGPKNLVKTLTREKLEQLTVDLIEQSIGTVRQVLQDAKRRLADIDEIVLVGGMTRMPAVQETVGNLFCRGPHQGVKPDDYVAIGAAIQAGILEGVVTGSLLKDVNPLTLSLETTGGVATPIIPRNSSIPTRQSYIFSTAQNRQTKMVVHLLQGERVMAEDNHSVGRYIIDQIPSAAKGAPRIEVIFEIDDSGLFKIHAQDKLTGRPQHISER